MAIERWPGCWCPKQRVYHGYWKMTWLLMPQAASISLTRSSIAHLKGRQHFSECYCPPRTAMLCYIYIYMYSLGEPPNSKGNGKAKAKQRQYKSKAKAKQSEDKARERPRVRDSPRLALLLLWGVLLIPTSEAIAAGCSQASLVQSQRRAIGKAKIL